MDRFRVAATGHSVNYLPEYVAASKGFFREEGLEVEAIVPDPWSLVLNEIKDGTSQAALGGIWVPSMYHGRGRRFVPFAQLSARCPLCIVGRVKERLDFRTLPGKTVLVPGGNGTSPLMMLEMLLGDQGVDRSSVHVVQNLAGRMLAELFVGSLGDYLLTDSISALRLARGGDLFIASMLAQDGGAVPWSIYYTEGHPGSEGNERLVRFARALNRGMQWVREHPAQSLSDLLTRLFPSTPLDELVQLVDSSRAWGMWDTPTIDRSSYQRWQLGMVSSHLVTAPIAYADMVNAQVASAALR